MSLTDERALTPAGMPGQRLVHTSNGDTRFAFVPTELASKCRELVHSYHAIHGYGTLPDMLWHSDARDIIECNRDLATVFNNASKTRHAKRAHDSFVLIATIILSIEVLTRDFVGWGRRFPAAKRDAEAFLVDFPQRDRSWFMDQYLYPSLTPQREFAKVLTPSATHDMLA
jgi:hypothetical protein